MSSDLDAVAGLSEPTRRALYDWVAAGGDWVGRDAAAEAVGLERGTAAHHLDRLAADGLLEVDYRRLGGRSGPGAGRPAKVYRRADREVAVSLPPRDYELAGDLLARAVERSRTDGTAVDVALDEAARAEGGRIADAISSQIQASGARGAGAKRTVVLDALAGHGFEPVQAPDGSIALRNCPFHRLAQQHTDLICGMNLCLLDAAFAGLDGIGLRARLDPEPGQCCVKLDPAP